MFQLNRKENIIIGKRPTRGHPTMYYQTQFHTIEYSTTIQTTQEVRLFLLPFHISTSYQRIETQTLTEKHAETNS